jgi:hypothetical protein
VEALEKAVIKLRKCCENVAEGWRIEGLDYICESLSL